MSDHTRRRRASSARTVVGVRELKTHAAGILRHVREARATYVLTHRGRAVGMIVPLETGDEGETSSATNADAAWRSFTEAGRRLESRFRSRASGVQLLSKMRR